MLFLFRNELKTVRWNTPRKKGGEKGESLSQNVSRGRMASEAS